MKTEIITAIIAGLLVVFLWGMYITFIYLDDLPNTMESVKDCNTWNPNAAQTRSICLPKVYTTFGWTG